MRTLLICHDGAELHQDGLARWLASFSDLAGIVVIREQRATLGRRARRELQRVGPLRFADVLAFRLYYRLRLAGRDRRWTAAKLRELRQRYPDRPSETPVLVVPSPNGAAAEAFIRRCAPDLAIALCKTILKPQIFRIPPRGTYVLHPGICPEYRNAHGCFWALASGDVANVGMTLLRIDEGVDTGPIYGYFRCPYDEVFESHVVIQHRVILDNLDAVRDRLLQLGRGEGAPLDIAGRPSAVWGQPWLSRYLRWRYQARRRRGASGFAALPRRR